MSCGDCDPKATGAIVKVSDEGRRISIGDPWTMSQASAFLWNRHMLLQVNCRGFATAQYMQPEPRKYSHAPALEQRTFMQPEQPYYAQHPGRFLFLRDDESGECWSLPFEPMRTPAEKFEFRAESGRIGWRLSIEDIEVSWDVTLPTDEVVELWTLRVGNRGTRQRKLSLYPCFTIGYMSWMNQSAAWDERVGGIVARSITPYQKLEDQPQVAELKDQTFLVADRTPDAWEASQQAFEGRGGWHNPDGLQADLLAGGDALYETPIGVLQFQEALAPSEQTEIRMLFGPARDEADILDLRETYLTPGGFEAAGERYSEYLGQGKGCLRIQTPEPAFDQLSNEWLARQVYYHGDTQRLTTDPQTRNYLQDAMGMIYLAPERTREALLTALSQQEPDGAMPEGILLAPDAELKYINQVPHMDHGVWLAVCLAPYLAETGDFGLLNEPVTSADGKSDTVFNRVNRALQWLLDQRDERGLMLINQGDWCDPMNMVGPAGKGVSGWLSIAVVHALQLWQPVAEQLGDQSVIENFSKGANELREAVQSHLWDGRWFARGITDGGKLFGISDDPEGRIYLNPQAWALMTGLADESQHQSILESLEEHLATPWGMMMLAPAYTSFREDIGRVTQKFPGSAENGAIYNHAAAFLIHALYRAGEPELAWRELQRMLPLQDGEDLQRRGQLPAFIPNYYRGAVKQHPRTAGRSSQLFNTGTASWVYRILVEDLFGLRGEPQGLRVDPALPSAWKSARASRQFRGARLTVVYERIPGLEELEVLLDGELQEGSLLTTLQTGQRYQVNVRIPGETE